MSTFLSKLFRNSSSPKDGLTQPEREAIADVLLYCMYADNHIALAEDKFIHETMIALDWESGTTFEYFEAQSVARVREAKEHADSREGFFKSVQARLSSKLARSKAVELSHRLFLADGVESEKESQLEAKLKQLLG